MAITLIIVLGIISITVAALGFDYLSAKKKSPVEAAEKIQDLERRLEILEKEHLEQSKKLSQIEDSTNFVQKLLMDKSDQ